MKSFFYRSDVMKSITSSNATFTLTIPGVYAYAVPLQEFAVDDSFTAKAVEVTEIRVGVDGYGVGGFVPTAVPMVIKLLASSPSIVVFENWFAAMAATNDVYYGIGVISQPSLGRKYIMPYGLLKKTDSLAVAKKPLQHPEFTILWLPQGPGVPAIRAVPV
jgi:hypothetical protein